MRTQSFHLSHKANYVCINVEQKSNNMPDLLQTSRQIVQQPWDPAPSVVWSTLNHKIIFNDSS